MSQRIGHISRKNNQKNEINAHTLKTIALFWKEDRHDFSSSSFHSFIPSINKSPTLFNSANFPKHLWAHWMCLGVFYAHIFVFPLRFLCVFMTWSQLVGFGSVFCTIQKTRDYKLYYRMYCLYTYVLHSVEQTEEKNDSKYVCTRHIWRREK